MRSSHRLALLLTILTAVALVAGCSSDKPKTPTAPPATPVTPAPPQPGAALAITTSSGAIPIGSTDPVQVTVSGQRTDNGTALPDGTAVTLRTTLGGFGSPGGAAEVNLTLVGGRATAALFPANTIGIAMLRAEKPADGRYGFAFAEAQVLRRAGGDHICVSARTRKPERRRSSASWAAASRARSAAPGGRAWPESRITVECRSWRAPAFTPVSRSLQYGAGSPTRRQRLTYAAKRRHPPAAGALVTRFGPNGGTNVVINGDGLARRLHTGAIRNVT